MNSKGFVFMGMGFELMVLIFGSLEIGQKIDNAYHFNGMATAALSFIVLIGWFYHLILLIKKFESENNSPKS